MGIEVESVGHQSLLHDDANEQVGGFVRDLEKGLKEAKKQKSIAKFTDSSPPELLNVDKVKIKLTDGELKTADLEGYQDIFENEEVRRLTKNKRGRINHLKGDFTYNETDFDFHVGYTEKLGRVRIQKKGRPEGEVELLEEVFDFLYEYYNEHFIEV